MRFPARIPVYFVMFVTLGVVLSIARNPDAPQFTQDEVDAVVKTARDYDVAVLATPPDVVMKGGVVVAARGEGKQVR